VTVFILSLRAFEYEQVAKHVQQNKATKSEAGEADELFAADG
jgi:hypothetical protein